MNTTGTIVQSGGREYCVPYPFDGDMSKAQLLEMDWRGKSMWTPSITGGNPIHFIGTGINDPWHSTHVQWNGKRVKVVRGDCEVSQPVCLGRTGTITGWYNFYENYIPIPGFPIILPASCYHMAIISGDDGETFNANTSWCDII